MLLPDGTIPWVGGASRGFLLRTPQVNANPRIPAIMGGIIEVTGEEQLDTNFSFGVASVAVSIMANNLSPNEESKVSWYQLDAEEEPSKFVVRVEKGGSNEGILGDNPVMVSWIAWEK